MGIYITAVAGIGIEIDYEDLNVPEDFDSYHDDWDAILEPIREKIKHYDNINFEMAADFICQTFEEFRYYLLAEDPIFGVDEYLEEMNSIGYDLKKEDLKFVRDVNRG